MIKFAGLSKLNAFAGDKINVTQKLKFVFEGAENSGIRRKCWLPAFSCFPTTFLKNFFLGVVKSRDNVVKG